MSAERRSIALPIDEVTLLEDRGHVVRRGRLELPAGLARLRVEAIAPVAVDKTVAVEVLEGAARAADARIRRRAVVRLRDGDDGEVETAVAQLERERDALDAQIDAVVAARDVAEGEAAAVDAVADMTLADLAEDAAWGREVGAEWSERLGSLRAREREALEQIVEREHELEELIRLRRRLDARLARLQTPAEHERADLELDLVVDEAGPVSLRVDYLVPGACWRPYHAAQLREGQGGDETTRVEVRTDACVWQNTGEDWDHVQLLFSTERASLGAEPPRLASDMLHWQRKSEAIVVEARDEQVETAGLGVEAGPRAAAELPGIDDGGEVLALRAPARASVPSDGRPWRVALASFQSDAELARICCPEVSSCVVLRATLVNRGELPLLAGPVDLLRASGLVGHTSTLFVAPGERFELGWGPDADLRVHREVEVSDDKHRALSSWLTRTYRVDLRLSNLGARPRRVELKERIPVSELEKIKVELDGERTSRGALPDADGFVVWHVDLPPRGHERLELAYELRRHESVVGL